MSPPAILIVDDDPALRQLAEGVLSDEGWKVKTVADGPAALDALSAGEFQLVVTDLMMPGMTGIELARHIHQNQPGTGIILMSGQATVESAVEAFQYGVLDYLLKPFSPAVLLALVNRWQRTSELEAAVRQAESVLNATVSDLIVELEELLPALPDEAHQNLVQAALGRVRTLSELVESLRALEHIAT